VWLGSQRATRAVFVPPPAEYIDALMTNLEHFLHDQPERTPTLIKAALAHAQFETIHPFLDGNGRVGRLLITLLLCAEGILAEPTLYLSLYFKTNRQEYYQALQRVRSHGDWEGWLSFFLQGVFETAHQAFELAQQLNDMFERDRNQVQTLGKQGGTMLQVLRFAREKVIFAAPEVANVVGISMPSIYKVIRQLEELNILMEITNKKRKRRWCYREYVQLLTEGT
jgi:Fic family protein